MAFSLHVDNRGGERRPKRHPLSTTATLVVLGAVLAAFCAYDASPQGQGYVGASLGQAQRWVQGTLGGIKVMP